MRHVTDDVRAGSRQGLLLAAIAWLGPVAGVALTPVLPEMTRTFANEPGVGIKIALVATGPSLLTGLASVPFGFLVDRIGRRAVLLTSLLLFGAIGLLPLLFTSLDWIIASRLILGLAQAGAITSSTALISDYYVERERERWMAVQTGAAPVGAVVMVFLGGLLGTTGWHSPFLICSWGWILFPLSLMWLFEPGRHREAQAVVNDLLPVNFSWTQPIWIAVALTVSMVCFMLPAIQFSFLATERGMTSPAAIGLWSALVTLGSPLGSLLFVALRSSAPRKMTLYFALFAVGFVIMAAFRTVNAAIIGSLLANVGAGIMFPTMITWLLSTLPPAARGRGTGMFTAATFLGQFAGPMVIVGLQRVAGSLDGAVLSVGAICAVTAAIMAIVVFGRRRAPAASVAGVT